MYLRAGGAFFVDSPRQQNHEFRGAGGPARLKQNRPLRLLVELYMFWLRGDYFNKKNLWVIKGTFLDGGSFA